VTSRKVATAGAVRLGIVSTAHINRLVIPGAHASAKVELVAVASRDRVRAEEYARKWDIERAYGSYEELLEANDIDAVYISLPNKMHCPWSIKAMEAGKHVICEKPLSRSTQDVEEAFDTSERTGCLFTEAFMYRHNPQTARLVELVEGEAIGELRLIRSAFSYSLYDPGNIRLRQDVAGGSLMDVGCYCISSSRLLAGEPERVYGQSAVGPTGTDWVFTGSLQFSGNVLAQFDCGTALPARDELEVIGSGGSLRLDDPWHCRTPVIELRREDEVERIELEPVDSYQLELENFADAILGKEPLLLGREDAVAQARVLESLWWSSETAQAVSL
jgi:predicted dehydrogenase